MNARIGYVRISDKDQNPERQIEILKNEKCFKIFQDKKSGKNSKRPALKEMLNFIREGDIVVVSELDRLGRNNKDLTNIMNNIKNKGATVEALNLPTLKGIEDENLRSLINNLIIEIYKYEAEQERKNILERQKAGIKIAKENGKYKGKQLKYNRDDKQLNHGFNLFKEGYSDREVEHMIGINQRTFRRYRSREKIYRKDYPKTKKQEWKKCTL